MKKLLGLVAVLVILALSACAVTMPICATSNAIGPKTGEATTMFICGLPMCEGGILKAARNGGIGKISTVDSRITFIPAIWMPLIINQTTVISGE